MNTIYVVPGLFPERFTGTMPRFPYLETLLAHAQIEPLDLRLTPEHITSNPHLISYATDMATQQGLVSQYPYWLAAVPIHLHIEGDGLVLIDASQLEIHAQESKKLVQRFNDHYHGTGTQCFYVTESQWLIGSHQPIYMTTTHPLTRVGRTITNYLPIGEDALFWRQLFNETQMLFHDHEVNLAREEKQKKTISGLWLWDTLPTVHVQQFEVIDELRLPAAIGDWHEWTKNMTYLDTHLFRSLTNQLKQTPDLSIDIYATDHPQSRLIHLNKPNFWFFWRRPRPLPY